MARSSPEPLTPKQQALRDIEDARAALARHTALAVTEWSPRAVLVRSFEKHAALWIGGTALAGLALFRFAWASSSAQSSTSTKTASQNRSRSLRALLIGPVIALARKSAMGYASNLFESYLRRQRQVSPNGSGSTSV